LHEFSAATQMVELVLAEAQRRNAKKVLEVKVVVGKLSFLNPEQLRFAYEILSEGTMLESSKLRIEEQDGAIECLKCGYRGGLPTEDNPYYHLGIPFLRCPKCKGEARIIKGRDFTVKSIRIEV